jgi:hypothetical protein
MFRLNQITSEYSEHFPPSVHQLFYPIATRPLSFGLKRLGSESDYSPPTIVEAKNTWIYTSNPL